MVSHTGMGFLGSSFSYEQNSSATCGLSRRGPSISTKESPSLVGYRRESDLKGRCTRCVAVGLKGELGYQAPANTKISLGAYGYRSSMHQNQISYLSAMTPVAQWGVGSSFTHLNRKLGCLTIADVPVEIRESVSDFMSLKGRVVDVVKELQDIAGTALGTVEAIVGFVYHSFKKVACLCLCYLIFGLFDCLPDNREMVQREWRSYERFKSYEGVPRLALLPLKEKLD